MNYPRIALLAIPPNATSQSANLEALSSLSPGLDNNPSSPFENIRSSIVPNRGFSSKLRRGLKFCFVYLLDNICMVYSNRFHKNG